MQATLSSHLCGAVFHTSVCFSVIPHCLGTPGVLTSPSCGRGSWNSKELGTRVPSQSGGAVMPFWVLQAPPDSGGRNKEGPCLEVGVAMPRCHRSHGRWEPGPVVSVPRGWLRPEVTVHSHGVVAGPCLPHACPLPSRMQSARLAWWLPPRAQPPCTQPVVLCLSNCAAVTVCPHGALGLSVCCHPHPSPECPPEPKKESWAEGWRSESPRKAGSGLLSLTHVR